MESKKDILEKNTQSTSKRLAAGSFDIRKTVLAAMACIGTGCQDHTVKNTEANDIPSVEHAEITCESEKLEKDFFPQGDRNYLVIRASYPEEPYDGVYTDDLIHSMFDHGDTYLNDATYFSESIPGVGIGRVDIVGPYEGSENVGSGVSMREMLEQAVADGIDLDDYEHVVYLNHTDERGAAQAGVSDFVINDECYYKPHIWMHKTGTDPKSLASTLTHETLHNWVGHANFMDCGDDSMGENCVTVEYKNPTSVMGGSGDLDLTHRIEMGWIDVERVLHINGPGNYEITHRSNVDSNLPVGVIWQRDGAESIQLEWAQADERVNSRHKNGLIATIYDHASDEYEGEMPARGVDRSTLLIDLEPIEEAAPCSDDSWLEESAAEDEMCENPNYKITLEAGKHFRDPVTGMTLKVDEIEGDVLRFTIIE